ncbi:MAG: molybdopterin molybdenumtransferase MoeA [Gammaproteobacteria bacterium]|nr:molybdopterin molybdenumtransferase MoeA [Gammaproteobacteria bacterium]
MKKPITIPVKASCADDHEPGILSVEAARKHILSSLPSLHGHEKLALRSALNRVLAKDIISPLDVPGHTNSAMDGYAFIGSDLPTDEARSYRVIGSVYAGDVFNGECQPGECIRIMTGAPMPVNTDTVVMQEHTMSHGEDQIRISSEHHSGQNVRQAGEDIAAGSVVLNSGRQLIPADLGILASFGVGEVRVRRRPRVAFFSTGDELRSIGEPLNEGDVYDSNRYTLYGMLKRLDVELLDLGVIGDSEDALREAFESAAGMADIVITSGGVSVGEADYTKIVLEQLGEMNFWKIAMKPGRPLTYGTLKDARFFGLPGNPVAVMVTFYQFVLPALHYLTTGKPYAPFMLQATCDEELRKRPGRYEFLRGILSQDGHGNLNVVSTGRQGSGILTSMSRGNCFIHLDEACAGIKKGDTVRVQPFDTLI